MFFLINTNLHFGQVMYRHHGILRNVADNLMSLIAEAGGESQDFFEDMFNPWPLHTLRTIMYPVRKNNIPDGANLPNGKSNNILAIHFRTLHQIVHQKPIYQTVRNCDDDIDYNVASFSCINTSPPRLWKSNFASDVWTARS